MALRELRLVAIGVADAGAFPATLMLLQETAPAGRILAIELSAAEVGVLEAEWTDAGSRHPTTLRLLGSVLEVFDRRLDQVRITAPRGTDFRAELLFDADTAVAARPSDAVMLALQCGVPVLVDEVLLARAGRPAARVLIVEPDPAPLDTDDIARFREFLDEVDPEDFGPH
jgi:bifunctional DNase/RNase